MYLFPKANKRLTQQQSNDLSANGVEYPGNGHTKVLEVGFQTSVGSLSDVLYHQTISQGCVWGGEGKDHVYEPIYSVVQQDGQVY